MQYRNLFQKTSIWLTDAKDKGILTEDVVNISGPNRPKWSKFENGPQWIKNTNVPQIV